jgi:DNA-binding CsgD family transcriptional regulator
LSRIQSEVADDIRATILSIQSLIVALFMAMSEPILGLIADQTELLAAYVALAGSLVPADPVPGKPPSLSRDTYEDDEGYKGTMKLCLTSAGITNDNSPKVLIEPLSQRELEVLQWLTSGASNREIGQRLSITESTVKRHVYHIFGKLNVHNRTQAALQARKLGIAPHPILGEQEFQTARALSGLYRT